MKVAYSVVLTDEYLKDVQRFAITQNPTLRLIYQTWWVKWLPRIIFAGALAGMFLFNQVYWPMVAMFGTLLILSFVQPIWSRRAFAKARNRNPIKGSAVTFSVDEQGVNTVGPNSNSHTQWSGLSSAIFYPQGVLLRIQNRIMMWLPDQSLVEGTPAEARVLVRQNVKECTESA